MKTFLKVISNIFTVIFVIVLIIACFFTASIGVCSIKSNTPDNYTGTELSSWMQYVDDEALIREIVLPGSHDAGTETMFYAGRTQKLTIGEQLNRGVRYFDIRVTKRDDNLFIFHSILEGDRYENIVDDISEFMENNKTEFLVLDFQHFKNDAKNDSLELLLNKLGKEALVVNDSNLSDLEFIDSLKMKDVRGKCLVTVGTEETNTKYDFEFVRDKDSELRENSVLHSYYEGSINGKSSSNYIKEGLPYYISLQKENNNGLFVLQGQLTDKFFIFGPAFRETFHEDKMSKYIKELKESDDLKYINIIMRDFIDAYKTSDILELNLYKENILKTDKKEIFSSILYN